MQKNKNNLFYSKVKDKGFKPKHVAEVGVWHPETSNIYQFIQDNIKTSLVEPDPESIKLIKTHFVQKENITLYEVAACDFDGEVELCKRGSSTFVSSLEKSPAIVNDSPIIDTDKNFFAKAVLFSAIDDGSIDLLSIDTEGCEWFVIKNLKSRPTVISVETHGGIYVNPYINEINSWANKNGYDLWYKDKSDSVFVLRDKIKVSFIEKITLLFSNLFIFLTAKKKKLSKMFK